MSNTFRSFTKSELFGFTEFLCKFKVKVKPKASHLLRIYVVLFSLANIGGLLGLFMGFSVLSVIEIVYFLTLRPYYINQRQKSLLERVNIVS